MPANVMRTDPIRCAAAAPSANRARPCCMRVTTSGGEGGEGREPAANPVITREPPLPGATGRISREQSHRDPPTTVAADEVGGERTRRDRGEVRIQCQAEPPAQERPRLAPMLTAAN